MITENAEVTGLETEELINNLLKQGFAATSGYQWVRAEEAFTKVLRLDENCAEAYVGKLLIEMRVNNQESLMKCKSCLDNSENYKKAIQYGTDELKFKLMGYNEYIKKQPQRKQESLEQIEREKTLARLKGTDSHERNKQVYEPAREQKNADKGALIGAVLAVCIIFLVPMMVILSRDSKKMKDTGSTARMVSEVSEIETTAIYNDLFLALANRVGTISFDKCVDMVDDLGYKSSIVVPTENDIGKITIVDNNGFTVLISFYPEGPNMDGEETLSLLCYGNNDYEVSVSDDYHTVPKHYSTFNSNREEKHVQVYTLDALTEFLFGADGVAK